MALLARESLSGYDLAQHMKRPIGFFWQAQLSQIYPELAHLEEQGCVQHQVIVREDRPSRKVYTITEAGLAALREWVVQSPTPALERNELLLKTYAIWLADPEAALELFRAREQLHTERQALFEQIQRNIESETGATPRPDEPRFGDYATVRMGVAYEREYMTWCRWVIEQFEKAQENRS